MSAERKPWVTSADLNQAYDFIESHPDITSIDLILFDINGKERGKRIPVSSLPKVYESGVCMPASVFALDIKGETIEETGLGFDQGDSDRICRIVPGSLQPIPWKPGVAQAVLTMCNRQQSDGFFADPRLVLTKQLQDLQQQGFNPCVAVEYEFYLQDLHPDEQGNPQPPIMPLSQTRMAQTQVYSLDELDEFKSFIDEVIEVCQQQGIPASNISAEYAPGQFEVNLKHSSDVVAACDQSMLMKRVIRAIAKKHGFCANFMAKPYSEYSGNGCHIHVSLLDNDGNNIFSDQPEVFQHAIAGILKYMSETMAILAPNANSYRRFQPNMFVSMQPNWGWDNRTVALRVPSDTEENRRVEHRVAGADCNPYLVVGVILASILEGVQQQLQAPQAIDGNGFELPLDNPFPLSWPQALEQFDASKVLERHLSANFCRVYHANKYSEQLAFATNITPLEYEWYQ
ncbi:glutamine synthetase family protein [Vibrio hippocampi]|uniref:Gamma-glutamylputrescine synthetase PuuA n=1 Tax=Vibrio hippocampi TaxID=654686 RepID=A0ABM8ZNI9_9VIBR|nr:glutamine synthetase family protein [Vibrio hippocampi]CAH0529827.1 Gamma-glutamylputrescine synthetase PuuA [Vibrio hippocampi]